MSNKNSKLMKKTKTDKLVDNTSRKSNKSEETMFHPLTSINKEEMPQEFNKLEKNVRTLLTDN